jgi:hypothetical protein
MQSNVSFALSQSSVAPSTKAPVYMHFSPKVIDSSPGASAGFTLIAKNKGSATFNATSCTVWEKYPGQPYKKEKGCPVLGSYSLSPGQTVKLSDTLKIASDAKPGTYYLKIIVYDGGEQSHAAILQVDVS